MTSPATGTDQGPLPKSRLLPKPGTPPAFTGVRTTDTRTALTRGLAEYLEGLKVLAPGGRYLQFKRVLDTWAEPEQQAKYPSAAITAAGSGKYEATGLGLGVDTKCRLPPPDGRYLVKMGEFVQELTIEVWANDIEERAFLAAAVEDYLNPVEWMYGFLLELPHYFNQRALFSMTALEYLDSDDDAAKRYRKASFSVTASVPLTKLFSFPDARPIFDLQAVGDGAGIMILTLEVL